MKWRLLEPDFDIICPVCKGSKIVKERTRVYDNTANVELRCKDCGYIMAFDVNIEKSELERAGLIRKVLLKIKKDEDSRKLLRFNYKWICKVDDFGEFEVWATDSDKVPEDRIITEEELEQLRRQREEVI